MHEVRVYDSSGAAFSFSEASMSSTLAPATSAATCIDGVTGGSNNMCHTGASDQGAWWAQFDLGSVKLICGVKVWNRYAIVLCCERTVVLTGS